MSDHGAGRRPDGAPDRIFVSRIEFAAQVGVTGEERARPQTLSVDVELWTDLRRAASTDAVEDSVDYGQIVDCAVRIGTERPYRLLEALAERVAEAVLELGGKSVRVLVRKPDPPLATPLDYVSVEVFRDRKQAAK